MGEKDNAPVFYLVYLEKKNYFFFSILDDSHYVHTNVHITWLKWHKCDFLP